MNLDPAYQTYIGALRAVIDLPGTEAGELDDIERRSRAELDALDRTRRDAANRWVGIRDDAARLSRRVDELAERVGAPPAVAPVANSLSPQDLPGALAALRSDLDAADQAWQWVLRHRARSVAQPSGPPPPPAPVHAAAPIPEPAPQPNGQSIDPKVWLAVAGLVIVVLVIVIAFLAL